MIDGDDVAEGQRVGGRQNLGRGRRVHDLRQKRQRDGRDVVVRFDALGAVLRRDRDADDVVPFAMDLLDPGVEPYLVTRRADGVGHPLREAPEPAPRVHELVDQANDLPLRRNNRVLDGGHQRHAFGSLRDPVAAHLVAGKTPHLLGVALEKEPVERRAELIDVGVLHRLDRRRADALLAPCVRP